jgi:hypothetical protein
LLQKLILMSVLTPADDQKKIFFMVDSDYNCVSKEGYSNYDELYFFDFAYEAKTVFVSLQNKNLKIADYTYIAERPC